jgi:hypothetical protein
MSNKHLLSKSLLLLLIISALLTGCRSSRRAAEQAADQAGQTAKQQTKELTPLQYVTGKLDFTARKNGTNSLSVGGSIKMGRNEIIQLSLVYFIMEVGRLEITPEYILVLDKYNSRYIRKAWADLPQTEGLGYEAIQQFFWGEYPMQGRQSLTIPLSASVSLELSYLEWKDTKYKEIVRFFVTDDENHIPIRLDLFLKFGSAKAFLVSLKGNRHQLSSQLN